MRAAVKVAWARWKPAQVFDGKLDRTAVPATREHIRGIFPVNKHMKVSYRFWQFFPTFRNAQQDRLIVNCTDRKKIHIATIELGNWYNRRNICQYKKFVSYMFTYRVTTYQRK